MGKSDLLKDGMKSGLDGLLSSTEKIPAEKGNARPRRKRNRRYIAISSSTKRAYPHEIPGHRKEYVSP